MELQLPNCGGYRAGTLQARARTQSSIAVGGGDSWALVNASPDILAQLQANPDLQPGRAIRDSAIAAIVLVDGQVDHTTGLYMLRESVRPWSIWCTDSTFADLTKGNPVFGVLGHFCGVDRRRIGLENAGFRVDGVPGCGGAHCRSQASPLLFAEPRFARPGRQPGAGDRGRGDGQNGGVCAGLKRHRRGGLARHASGLLRDGGRHVLDGR